MTMRLAAATLAAVVWGAGIAAAQTQDERIEIVLARARAAGIPVELLEDKIAEGRAKGVSMDRIATALEHRAAGLARAQQALAGRPDVGPADLAVAADALDAGVSEAVLKAVGELAPRDRRTVAIAALEQLVQNGQTPERALDRVREALQRSPEALLRLSGGRPEGRPSDIPARPDTAPPGGRPDGIPAPGAPPQDGRPADLPGPPAAPGGRR